ncbi:hypothetical protein ACFLVS_07260, partial [Chloroflexota bacterium]
HLVEVRQNDLKLFDGFKSVGGLGERWVRDAFDHFHFSLNKVNILLFKLHGSTSWYKDDSGNIKKISEAAPQIGRSRVVLIYPTQVKATLFKKTRSRRLMNILKLHWSIRNFALLSVSHLETQR